MTPPMEIMAICGSVGDLGGDRRTHMTRFELSLQTTVNFWLFIVLDLMSWLNSRCESIIFSHGSKVERRRGV
jgi:hypothetical protein